MIGPNDLAQLFRVELAGECGRIHQVTKQHGELAAFCLWGRGCGRGYQLRQRSLLCGRL